MNHDDIINAARAAEAGRTAGEWVAVVTTATTPIDGKEQFAAIVNQALPSDTCTITALTGLTGSEDEAESIANLEYITASTHPETGWAACAKALEEAVAELQHARSAAFIADLLTEAQSELPSVINEKLKQQRDAALARAEKAEPYRHALEQRMICSNMDPLLTGDADADLMRYVFHEQQIALSPEVGVIAELRDRAEKAEAALATKESVIQGWMELHDEQVELALKAEAKLDAAIALALALVLAIEWLKENQPEVLAKAVKEVRG
jgi:hypothetical protein